MPTQTLSPWLAWAVLLGGHSWRVGFDTSCMSWVSRVVLVAYVACGFWLRLTLVLGAVVTRFDLSFILFNSILVGDLLV